MKEREERKKKVQEMKQVISKSGRRFNQTSGVMIPNLHFPLWLAVSYEDLIYEILKKSAFNTRSMEPVLCMYD